MNDFLFTQILTELEDAVGRENCSVREIDKVTHSVDYFWLSRMWADRGRNREFCRKYNFDYHQYDALNFPVVNLNDGIMYWCFHNEFKYKKEFYTKEFGETMRASLPKMKEANRLFEEIASGVSEDRRGALRRQWCYQSYLWVCFFSAAELLCDLIERADVMTEENFISVHKQAAECFLKVLQKRKEYYTGKWKKWFDGDQKVSVKTLYDLCRLEIAHVRDYLKAG